MALFEVIKKEFDDDNLVWRYPKKNFNNSSQLIVYETQEAVFFSNGKALDLFEPGKYTLETNNIPLLRKLLQIPTGGKSSFRCEVYFIDKALKTLKWGTSSKIEFLEPVYKFPIAIGACGEIRFTIEDSRKILLKLVGVKKNFDGASIDEFFNSQILVKVKSYIAQIITKEKICIFEIDQMLEKFSKEIEQKLSDDFKEYGIKLNNFFITNIAKPEDDKQYLEFKELYFKQSVKVAEAKIKKDIGLIEESEKAERIKMTGDAMAYKRNAEGYSYQDEKGYKLGEKIAENQAIGQFTNVGVGLGMMSGLSSPLSEKVSTQVTGAFTKIEGEKACPNCGTLNEIDTNFCKNCGKKLKQNNCPKCGYKLDNDAKFCSNCGERIN